MLFLMDTLGFSAPVRQQPCPNVFFVLVLYQFYMVGVRSSEENLWIDIKSKTLN